MPKYAPGQTVRSATRGIVQIRHVENDSMIEDLVQYLVELNDGSTLTIAGINLVEAVHDPSFDQRHRTALGHLTPVHDELLMYIAQLAGEVMKVESEYVALDPETLAALAGVSRYFRDLVTQNRRKLGFYDVEVRGLRTMRREWQRTEDVQIVLPQAQAVQATCERLMANDLLAIRRVAEYILHTYPPEQYLYVGLGGSPTPITAYLQLCGRRARVVDVPVSSLNQYRANYEEIWENEDYRTNVVHYLNRYLGKSVDIDTQLLVIDYSSGNSLFVIEYLLRKYLEERYTLSSAAARDRVLPLAINDQVTASPPGLDSRIVCITLEQDPLFTQLLNVLDSAVFKDMAYRLYGKVHITDVMSGQPQVKATLAEYQDLCAQLRAFLKRYRAGQQEQSASSGALMGSSSGSSDNKHF